MDKDDDRAFLDAYTAARDDQRALTERAIARIARRLDRDLMAGSEITARLVRHLDMPRAGM